MIIGFAAVMLILVVWQMLAPPRRPQPAPQPVQAAPVQPAPVTPVLATPAVTPPALPETTVTLENDAMRVELTSDGASLKSVLLKRYRAELVPAGSRLLRSRLFAAGETVDLAHVPAAVSATPTSASFSYAVPGGTFTKSYFLDRDYILSCSVSTPNPGLEVEFDALEGIATTERDTKEDLMNFHFYAREDGKVHQASAAVLRRKPHAGTADWVGLKSKYFLLALLSPAPNLATKTQALPDGRCGFVASAGGSSATYTIYVGPIQYSRLRSFGIGLESVVSLGWLKPVALAILWVLHVFHYIFRNWGVAIIFFSLLMKAIFFPLTRIQTRQMRQMQLLQPKINELKEKYKNDPQLLNQETMRLYQLYKINPLSGCLPLLVQMPVFFALYAVLRTFIELRGAGFMLWLKDLSQPDTLLGHVPRGFPLIGGYALGLLPILMGVSFIAQNFLTSTDKKNWAMTIIFPVFITAIFLNLSSGLQLYWFTYNVLSILESVISTRGGRIWRRLKGPTAPTLTTAPPPK